MFTDTSALPLPKRVEILPLSTENSHDLFQFYLRTLLRSIDLELASQIALRQESVYIGVFARKEKHVVVHQKIIAYHKK